jgi:uncharacterized membrane protein YkvA (DUF1232 family)
VSIEIFLVGFAVAIALYAAFALILVAVGRRTDARALARFIPDCLVLFKRLLADPRVPRYRKALLVLLLGYLAFPIDLIPDFIPVVGQLDDVIISAVVLRIVLRGGGPALFDQHWPGSPEGGALIRRMAFGTR